MMFQVGVTLLLILGAAINFGMGVRLIDSYPLVAGLNFVAALFLTLNASRGLR